MPYHVIAPDGRLYGPADEATLAQWAVQGRLDASSNLVRHDGVTMPASAVLGGLPGGLPNGVIAGASVVAGFRVGGANPSGPGLVPPTPPAGGFLRLGARGTGSSVGTAYTLALISFACLPLFPAIAGLVVAVKASQAGQRGAMGAVVANVLGLLFGIATAGMLVSFVRTMGALGSLPNR